ncbi:MAG: NAD-dependent epimerase/dehydratase family protein [Acidimicrobiia bacterium]|nr:NAD-dependent epimerase/dehydratase family protein [Acidimicrobiia bacterium]
MFVTGGTGFVGGGILAALANEGRQVRALTRDRTGAQVVAATGAEPVVGHLFEPEVLRTGMADCSTVFHAAGVNAMCLDDPSDMWRVNVGGSLNVLDAASAAGVRRVVYTSSAATIGEPRGVVATEATVHRGWFLSEYEKSKFEAEKAVSDRAKVLGVELVVVNPSSVQGPGRTTGSAQLVLAALNARLVPSVDVHVSVVDIDDCSTAHLLAERSGVDQERYLINGATMVLSEVLQNVRAITGARHLSVPIPRALVKGLLPPLRFKERFSRSSTLCAEMLDTVLHGHRFDAKKSEEALGMAYRPPHQLFGRLIQWYADYGFIQRSLPNVRKSP